MIHHYQLSSLNWKKAYCEMNRRRIKLRPGEFYCPSVEGYALGAC